MRFLKQSTSVDVPIGPFLDATDGVTAETALTITQPDIRLKKNGGAWAQKAASQTLTHEENGNYEVTLDATDTDTLGLLRVHVAESGALPVWEDFMVMPANVWDSLFGADALQVHVVEFTAAVITATAIAGDAFTAAKFAADVTTELQSGLATASAVSTLQTTANNIETDTQDIQSKIGTPAGASIAADLVVIDNFVDDLEGRLTAGRATALDNLDATISSRASQTSVDTIDDFLDTEIAAIKAKTDNLPASPAAAGDQMALTSAAIDAILDDVVEGSTTMRQLLRGFASALLAKASGLETTTAKYRDLADSKDRITATVDADGNRTAVTLDLS